MAASASQLYRFVREIQPGDLVAYPSKVDRHVPLGRIESDYNYISDTQAGFTHQRRVTWLKMVMRTYYSQGALYELGSALTLFQVCNYVDEHISALHGAKPPQSGETDETVALVAEEVEATTRDFVLKAIARELKGHPSAQFVAHLLEVLGCKTRVSPRATMGAST